MRELTVTEIELVSGGFDVAAWVSGAIGAAAGAGAAYVATEYLTAGGAIALGVGGAAAVGIIGFGVAGLVAWGVYEILC